MKIKDIYYVVSKIESVGKVYEDEDGFVLPIEKTFGADLVIFPTREEAEDARQDLIEVIEDHYNGRYVKDELGCLAGIAHALNDIAYQMKIGKY